MDNQNEGIARIVIKYDKIPTIIIYYCYNQNS